MFRWSLAPSPICAIKSRANSMSPDPMALQARAGGTPERPRLEDITLKIPLFGSSDYNAVVTGKIEFTERRTWEDAKLEGKLTIDPLSLAACASRSARPPAGGLVTEGSVSIYSRFEGTWNHLRIGALVRADKSELRYKDWLRKPAERPGTIRARISTAETKVDYFTSRRWIMRRRPRSIFPAASRSSAAPRLRIKLAQPNRPLAALEQFSAYRRYARQSGGAIVDISPSNGRSCRARTIGAFGPTEAQRRRVQSSRERPQGRAI